MTLATALLVLLLYGVPGFAADSIALALTQPWPGEQGIIVTTLGVPWRPRPYTSAIVYRPDGSTFTLRRHAVRGHPQLASLRFPTQPAGTTVYVTVEQESRAYGVSLVLP